MGVSNSTQIATLALAMTYLVANRLPRRSSFRLRNTAADTAPMTSLVDAMMNFVENIRAREGIPGYGGIATSGKHLRQDAGGGFSGY